MMEEWYCYTIATKTGPELVYSGATNDLRRRMRQHNGELRTTNSLYTQRRFGTGNVLLKIVIGPTTRARALSVERRLKKYNKGNRLAGRVRAVTSFLLLPGYIAKSARLTAAELRGLRVETSLSREEWRRMAPQAEFDGYNIHFNVEWE